MIVLDTSVLSLAFRRQRQHREASPQAAMLRKWIADDVPLAVPGIVLQELLSGVRNQSQFHELQDAMAGFPVLLAKASHHVRAAEIVNMCRGEGIACSTVDALIAALASEAGGRLFTVDADFRRIAPQCGLRLVD